MDLKIIWEDIDNPSDTDDEPPLGYIQIESANFEYPDAYRIKYREYIDHRID